ncbi:MAG: hypothetical protein PHX43_00125 [Alphaproteobacteria bacterium]|nr:hypothetical protein [Alphaproteobacteria bacterium]
MKTVEAIVRAGHRVASGESKTDVRFPEGTIRMQAPFFKERGFDLRAYFDGDFVYGTLNLSIAPHSFAIAQPEHFFDSIKWTPLQPAENFFMTPAQINFRQQNYKAIIYIPDPATKPAHFQAPDIIEVIAQTIPDLHYGDKVNLTYNPKAIVITLAENGF